MTSSIRFRGAAVDGVLYGASALFALLTAAAAGIPQFREWGRVAVVPYAVATVASLVLVRRGVGLRGRWVLAVTVLVGTGVLPLAFETVWRSHSAPGFHAQSEVIVTEEAARALVRGRDPYREEYLEGPLAARPLPTKTHVPYLPGLLVFGMPRALDGNSPAADARVGFAMVAMAGLALALARRGERDAGALRVAQVLVVLPTGAALMATGGDDLPVLALMLLALVLVSARRPGWGGLAAGAAAAMKQTAWLLLPFLILASPSRRRTAGAIALVVVPVVTPFLVWHPGDFVEDALKFPLGLGAGSSAAGSVTLGSLLADTLPGGEGTAVILLLLAVGGVGAWLVTRRPWPGTAGAARAAGVLWLLAYLLAPAARLGYLAYPVNLLTWSVALAAAPRAPRSDDHQGLAAAR
jgi:hypothetical protein